MLFEAQGASGGRGDTVASHVEVIDVGFSAAANRFQIDLKNRIELNRPRYIDLTNSESIRCRGRHSPKEMLI